MNLNFEKGVEFKPHPIDSPISTEELIRVYFPDGTIDDKIFKIFWGLEFTAYLTQEGVDKYNKGKERNSNGRDWVPVVNPTIFYCLWFKSWAPGDMILTSTLPLSDYNYTSKSVMIHISMLAKIVEVLKTDKEAQYS